MGNAPDKNSQGCNGFHRWVYTQVYRKMEMAPNRALFGLILYKMAIPPRVKITANTSAKVIDILPAGSGLFMVLCIKASVVFSIIWLNVLEAATIRNPPKLNRRSVG